MVKLRKLIYKENSGDFSGAGTFQGGAYGFGDRHQLADSEIWPGLVDPAEDLPPNPSMWPAVKAQRNSDHDQYDSLESKEVFDDRPHLLPQEDQMRDELLDPKNDIDPSYFYIAERSASDIFYRDLQGFPKMNTIADPVDHVPEDEDLDNDSGDSEEERYNVPRLLPGDNETNRGKPFGHGSYDMPNELDLNKNKTDSFDPMEDELTDNNLKLTDKRNKTLNRWKETDPESMGSTNRDAVFNHLVKPVNWIKKEFGQTDYKKELDEEDDVQLHPGVMGTIVNPVKHVPGPVNIYSKSTGYQQESKGINNMASKKNKTVLAKKEDFVPEELDKKISDKPYGNGFGTIVKKHEKTPASEDRDIKTIEPLKPEENYIPYDNKDSKFEIIMQTKLFEKLAKLTKK